MLSAFKNFLITFLIAALLFGTVGYFATAYLSDIITGIIDGDKKPVNVITSDDDDEEQNEDNVDNDNLQIPDGNSFSFAVIGTDYRPEMIKTYYKSVDDYKTVIEKAQKKAEKNEKSDVMNLLGTKVTYIRATWIAVVRADKECREYAVCYISPETAVTVPYGEATLGEVYGLYGLNTLLDYINALTGLDMDYTFVLDGETIEQFTKTMGEVNFDLPLDLYAGQSYHLSSPVTVIGDEDEEDDTTASEEDTTGTEKNGDTTDKSADKDKDKDKNKDKDKDKNKKDETEAKTEVVENIPVMKKGKYALDDYSVDIINTFREESADDVAAKSSVIRQIVKLYLNRFAEWSASDLTSKMTTLTKSEEKYDLNDPYSVKPTVATEFDPDEVQYIHSMLGAVKYFDYVEMTYPGSYSEKTGKYQPDIKSGLILFEKYRQNSGDKQDNSAETDK